MIPLVFAAAIPLLDQAVAVAGVFCLGMCFALLGTLSVQLVPRLGIDHSGFGTLISLFMATCLIASLGMSVFVNLVGFGWTGVAGFLATGTCMALLSRSRSVWTAGAACMLLGFGAMALNTIGNGLLDKVLFSGQNPGAAFNIGNAFFGMGLFVVPAAFGILLGRIGFGRALLILSAVPFGLAVLPLFAPLDYGAAAFDASVALALLGQPATLAAGVVLFCYIALEATFCNWLVPFGQESLRRSDPGRAEASVDAEAQRLLSIFAVALVAGRLSSGALIAAAPLVAARQEGLIVAAAAVSAVVVWRMITSDHPAVPVQAAALTGFAFGPVFPSTLAIVAPKYDPAFWSTNLGMVFACGLLGAVVTPKLVGMVAARRDGGIRGSLGLLLPLCVLLAGLALTLPLAGVSGSVAAQP